MIHVPENDPVTRIWQPAQQLMRRAVDLGVDRALPLEVACLATRVDDLAVSESSIVVLGESGSGKSSFVNGLIGRPGFLPTSVAETTSQVFRITSAAEVSIQIRFEDESVMPIEPDELALYGSQVIADRDGPPSLKEIIRWIDVALPLPPSVLPRNVALFDVPGLGTLNSAHTRLLQHRLQRADAAIVVLSADRYALTAEEVGAINAFLDLGRPTMFILPKMDIDEHWDVRRSRYESSLPRQLERELPGLRVWPIANPRIDLTRQSPTTSSPDRVRRFTDITMIAFLGFVSAASWSRAATAVKGFQPAYQEVEQQLFARRDTLGEASTSPELQAQAADRVREFHEAWGIHGKERIAALDAIARETSLARMEWQQFLGSGGTLERTWRAKIEAITTVTEAKQFGMQFGAALQQCALDEWERLSSQTLAHVIARIEPLLVASRSLSPDSLVATHKVSIDVVNLPEKAVSADDSPWSLIKIMRVDVLTATWLGGFLTSLIHPLWPLTVAGGIWAASVGWENAKEMQRDRAKQELISYLASVRERLWHLFFDVDATSRRDSIADEYLRQIRDTAGRLINGIASRHEQLAKNEVERLNASVIERKLLRQQAEEDLLAWRTLGTDLTALLDTIDQFWRRLPKWYGPSESTIDGKTI